MRKLLLLTMVILTVNCLAQDNKELVYKKATDRIDKIVLYGLKKFRQLPNKKTDDYSFVRRVYLDIIGRIPTYKELLAFKKDPDRNKRTKLIDQLLNSEGYVSHNFNYWADTLRITHHVSTTMVKNYITFIKDSLRTNKPYDQFTKELLTAKGDAHKPGNGATGYYLRDTGMPLDNLSNTMKVFLGTSMECAQCHDHPFDRWSQMDFYKLAAFSSGIEMEDNISRVNDPDHRQVSNERKKFKSNQSKNSAFREFVIAKYSSVDHMGTGVIRLPHDYNYDDAKPFDAVFAKVPFGPDPKLVFKKNSKDVARSNSKTAIGPDINTRETFANWVISPDNPMFTKTIVNRLWLKYMGGSLMGNPTELSLKGSGPNPYLTAELVKVMKAVKYDLKEFQRIILRTETYQRSSSQVDLESSKKYVFHAPLLYRLSAEQIWDSLLSLTSENPDASLEKKPEYGGYEYLYNLFAKMKPNEIANYVEKSNYKNRRDIIEKTDAIADKMNLNNGFNQNSSRTTPIPNSNQERLKKLNNQLKKAQKEKDTKTAKKIKTQIALIRKKIDTDSSSQAGMSMVSNRRKNNKEDYSRASELPSPAPRGHFLRQFGQSDRTT
ncbi:MAG: DUF1549 and DUF1553 domain-containing protein, partial [Lentisphaeraceae bacterium]|nr:DUF1549 and DUF1553 domain-containing protein [Lentisphaeraceae bacterium]